MNKHLPAALLLGLAVSACGTQPDDARPDPADNYQPTINDDERQPVEEDEPVYIPEDEWGNWEEEEWQTNEGELTVLTSHIVGQVGSYLFNDESARASGWTYGAGSDWQQTTIDSRTTISGNEAVMVLLTVEGDLLADQLKNGATFNWDNWGDGAVYATAVGCSGNEGAWDDFDAPADEVEIIVSEDPEDPGVVTVQYVATWQSWDNPGQTFQAKGVSVVDLDG